MMMLWLRTANSTVLIIVILAIYSDSLLFVFLTAVFWKGIGIDDRSMHLCHGAAILCGRSSQILNVTPAGGQFGTLADGL